MSEIVVNSGELRDAAARLEALVNDQPGNGNQRDIFNQAHRQLTSHITDLPLDLGHNFVLADFVHLIHVWQTNVLQYQFDGYLELAKALRSIADQIDQVNAD